MHLTAVLTALALTLAPITRPALGDSARMDQPARRLQSSPSSQPLSVQSLTNLVAFTHLLGYVRYFHPSDEAADVDWNAFTIAAVDTIERADDADELAGILRHLFMPIAPTVRIDTRPVTVAPTSLAPPGTAPVSTVRWQHHGFGGGTREDASFWSRRSRTALVGRRGLEEGSIFSRSLGGGTWCAVPLVLLADSAGTLPRGGPGIEPIRAPRPPTSADRATRIADVILFWNIAQHFYPYFGDSSGWPAALRIALRSAATNRDAHSFHDTMTRLAAQLHDGHAGVTGEGQDSTLTLPIAWDWIEGQLVITQIFAGESAADPHRGDVVVSIDGRSVEGRLAEVEPRISAATPQRMRWGTLLPLARGSGRDSVALELRVPGGTSHRVTLGRKFDPRRFRWDRPDRVAEINPGVFYVDLTRTTDAELDSCLERLATARGIVFDMRGYPYRVSPRFFGHLTDRPLLSPRWGIPLVSIPDRMDMTFDYSTWTVEPAEPRIRARCAFLMDGRDQSGAETFLQIVAHYGLGELVGQATAGTDGTKLTVALPGGYEVSFTGMKALKQDGSPIQGVGVLPTVHVARTIAAVAAGRDELLEKAIQVVSH